MNPNWKRAGKAIAYGIIVGLLAWIGYGLQQSSDHLEAMQGPEYMNKTFDGLIERFNPYIDDKLSNSTDAIPGKVAESFGMTPEEMKEMKELVPTLRALKKSLGAYNATELEELARMSKEVEGVDFREVKQIIATYKAMTASSSPGLVVETERREAVFGSGEVLREVVKDATSQTSPRNTTLPRNETSLPADAVSTNATVVNETQEPQEPAVPETRQECPPATASGGVPPDEIIGECEGASYHCYRENLAPTLTDPAYYYGCSILGLEGRSPPDQMGGEYDAGEYGDIKYNCTLEPGESASGYQYSYRCTLD